MDANEVRYLTDDRDFPDHKLTELVISAGGNGDWYVATVPKGEIPFGRSVRLCTSGGASSEAPGLCVAIAKAFAAIQGTRPAPDLAKPESEGETPRVDAMAITARPFVGKGADFVSLADARSLERETTALRAELAETVRARSASAHSMETWSKLAPEAGSKAGEELAELRRQIAAVNKYTPQLLANCNLVADLTRERDELRKAEAKAHYEREDSQQSLALLKEDAQWRGIESAPKDGTKILIWNDGEIYAAWWDSKYEAKWDEEKDENIYRGAWTDAAVVSFGYEETAEYCPTHWMPLPSHEPIDAARAAVSRQEGGK